MVAIRTYQLDGNSRDKLPRLQLRASRTALRPCRQRVYCLRDNIINFNYRAHLSRRFYIATPYVHIKFRFCILHDLDASSGARSLRVYICAIFSETECIMCARATKEIIYSIISAQIARRQISQESPRLGELIRARPEEDAQRRGARLR